MPKISRRDFLKLVGAGGAGVGIGMLFSRSATRPMELLIPQPVMPEDYSPGIATWYNTVCRQCSAGCGVMVRTREGRAKKIEGNPAHPVSMGGLCALGQSAPNVLYNPDRLQAPVLRDRVNGQQDFTNTDWNAALDRVATQLQALKEAGRGDRVVLLSGEQRGSQDALFADFMQRLGAERYLHYDFTRPGSLYEANRRCFGTETLPYYDIRNADLVLSFGADFLGSWLSPVHYSSAYGHMRRGRAQRGKLVQIEPRMSLTGANADTWLPAIPGSEGQLALAMAHCLVRDGHYRGSDASAWRDALATYAPAKVAPVADIPAQRIEEIAAQFAAAKHAVAIGGGSAAHGENGVANLTAINLLNHLGGRVGAKGGVLFNADGVQPRAPDRHASHARLQQLAEDAQAGRIEMLILHDSNPLFTSPEATGLREALQHIPFIVGMSSFMNDTMAQADVILPLHAGLESWGDDMPEPGVGFPVASLSQPVVTPLYDTRSSIDILLALAKRIGEPFPWSSDLDYLRHRWREIFEAHRDPLEAMDFESFWNATLQSGVLGLSNSTAEAGEIRMRPEMLRDFDTTPDAPAGASDGEFFLQPYLSPVLLDGRGANLPWLQELPDPVTSVVYGSWAEINPRTAESMGLREGDLLEIESSQGNLRVPVVIYPAIRPDVIGIPIGQGHADYGRYASGRGINPIGIVEPVTDTASGELAWTATRVKVRKTGEKASVVKTSGTPRELGRNVLG